MLRGIRAWIHAWREARQRAKRERDAFVRITALLREQHAAMIEAVAKLTVLNNAAHHNAAHRGDEEVGE